MKNKTRGIVVLSALVLGQIGHSQAEISLSFASPVPFETKKYYDFPGAHKFAFGDFNNDGKVEKINCPQELTHCVSVELGDMNKDGNLDFVVKTIFGNAQPGYSIYYGDGGGSFIPNQGPTSGWWFDFESANFAVGDINNDGKLDIVDERRIFYGDVLTWRNEGVESPIGISNGEFNSMALADFNHDGYLDIVAGMMPYEYVPQSGPSYVIGRYGIGVALSDGKGSYKKPRFYRASSGRELLHRSINVGDINQDGNPDIIALVQDDVCVYLGAGDGQFKKKSLISGRYLYYPKQVLANDVNNDGKLDIVIAGRFGNKQVLINNGP